MPKYEVTYVYPFEDVFQGINFKLERVIQETEIDLRESQIVEFFKDFVPDKDVIKFMKQFLSDEKIEKDSQVIKIKKI